MEKNEDIQMYSKPGYLATDTRVVVGEYYKLESDILPGSPQQIEREIIIKQGATVAGNVCGRFVIVGSRVRILGSIICENARISPRAIIEGGVYASNEILIREDVHLKKDLIGNIITTHGRVSVDGHIYGHQLVTIGDDNKVQGVIYSEGDLTLGDYCVVRDVSSHNNMKIGNNCHVKDDAIHSSYGTIEYGEGLLLYDLKEQTNVPIEDCFKNFRKTGVEYSITKYGDTYYYVHEIDNELQTDKKTKRELVKGQLSDLWKFDLPLKDDNWETLIYSKEKEFEQVKNTLEGSWIAQRIPRITNNILSLVEDVGTYYFDLIRGLKPKEEPDNPPEEFEELANVVEESHIVEDLEEIEEQNVTEELDEDAITQDLVEELFDE
ncbi:MAG: hypothetical protein GPJ51_07035 [Candidatus Heimdallarchaeota archaeon]|nr:hypothetical protein [Candidatus Heimdallarchaeota archaeon]